MAEQKSEHVQALVKVLAANAKSSGIKLNFQPLVQALKAAGIQAAQKDLPALFHALVTWLDAEIQPLEQQNIGLMFLPATIGVLEQIVDQEISAVLPASPTTPTAGT